MCLPDIEIIVEVENSLHISSCSSWTTRFRLTSIVPAFFP